MMISQGAIEAAAPDQASLKAALGLQAASKWSDRQASADGVLVWGACQGSGANPYRVVVDLSDLGTKCTCPSRKFPCKHGLALMLLRQRGPGDFPSAPVPDWVSDWLGRRRKDAGQKDAGPTTKGDGKSLTAALAETSAPPDTDPEAEAKREAAREKRAAATRQTVSDGLAEMEAWIGDQLRTGLGAMLADLTARCRRIASRLVDAKAATLAARIDQMPARILSLPTERRSNALVSELGKLVILSRAWNDGETTPDVWREIVTAEPREALLADPATPRHSGAWEVLATREETRRDGLIARSTWLLGLNQDGPRFALLLDFFPASTGRQGAAFDPGEQFRGEIAYYPSAHPLRALLVTRDRLEGRLPWPNAEGVALDLYARALTAQPWALELPLYLPPGRFALAGEALWWQGEGQALPVVADTVGRPVRGTDVRGAAVLWDAVQAQVLAADTALGHHYVTG
jgi:hypothetical protein